MVKIQSFVIWIQTFFIFHVKTDDIYKDIAEDFETRFDNSNYEKTKKLMKDELGGEIMKKFCWSKSKNFQLLNK